VNSLGESLPIACPNQKPFQEFVWRWIKAAAGLKADVLFWDEPHFMIYPEQPEADALPKLWACRCPACEDLFKKQYNQPLPMEITSEVRAFKQDSLIRFIQALCQETAKAGLKSAVCLLPVENSSTIKDWSRVAAIPSLNIIGTDPYWRPHQRDVEAYVTRYSRRIKELADRFGKEGQIWILNFRIPKGEEGNIRTALEAGYREGIRNFAAWSYYGAAYMNLKSEDPEAVWKTLSQVYKDLQGRS